MKAKLKKALQDQVEESMTLVSPSAQKGYVFYSRFAEAGSHDRSAFVFVDPPARQLSHPIELPPDWVKVQNYAGWLTAMGLLLPARNLRERTSAPIQPVVLQIFEVGRFKIAGTPSSPACRSAAQIGLGIEVDILRRISQARAGDNQDLIDFAGTPNDARGGLSDTWSFEATLRDPPLRRRPGSLMGDATYLGPLRSRDFLGFEVFNL